MPKPKQYPLTPQQIESALADLIDSGIHLDGKRCATPKPPYFKNFRFDPCVDAEGVTVKAVATRQTRFRIRCEVHGTSFETSTRILFNTSSQLKGTTCIYCEREAGVGHGFITLAELAVEMAGDDAFDWLLDMGAVPLGGRNLDRIVACNEALPLVCKRTKWNSLQKCGAHTEHRVHNILTALRVSKGHIVCQSDCDSRHKGKSSRLGLQELEHKLAETRGGTWVLSRPADYRRVSEEQWFMHTPCGREVRRLPWQILGYSGAGSGSDCPYCTRSSVLHCVAGSIRHLDEWVQHVTVGAVHYADAAFPASNDAAMDFLCKCGNVFKEKLGNLTRYEHHGCPVCRSASLKAKRAWILGEARSLAERRGYELVDDPASYTEAAVIRSIADGTAAPYATILSLVQSMPVHAGGFGPKPELPAVCRSGEERRRYPVNDSAFQVLTPEACYWAGLLAADATIGVNATIVLELKAADEMVLQALAQFVGFAGVGHYRTVRNVAGRGIYCSIRFRSRQICSDLYARFGIGPRKTYTLPRPDIGDSKMERAYMTGLFEGDGHVRRTKRGPVVHFVSAAQGSFEWFLEQANAITLMHARARVIAKNKVPVFNVTYSDRAALKLLRSLEEAHPGHMSRKWKALGQLHP